MKKDDIWSIDRLLPRIHSSASFSSAPKSSKIRFLIADAEVEENQKRMTDFFTPNNSRVILRYRFSEEIPPLDPIQWENEQNVPKVPVTAVACNSFSPSFSTLNSLQKKTFFQFLRFVKKREKLSVSFAYLQLYLCFKISAKKWETEDYDEILWVWESFRSQYPLTDKLFSDTVSDFCFYRHQIPNYEMLGKIFTKRDMTARPFLVCTYLFDYLFDENKSLAPDEINLILRTLTAESFRKSKAYRYHKTFAAASEEAVFDAFRSGLFNRKDLNRSLFSIKLPSQLKTVRKLFQGLPTSCVPAVEFELHYVPFFHDENIRSRCDELIRYLENRIKKILKLKNSLSRIHISEEHRVFLEGILLKFESLAPSESDSPSTAPLVSETKREPIRDFNVDFEVASQIEESSWEITQALTDSYKDDNSENIVLGGDLDHNFDLEYQDALNALETPKEASSENDFWEFAAILSEIEDTFIRISLHQGIDAARMFAQQNGFFFDAFLLSCNQKAMETIDDAIFDPSGNPYQDYLQSLKEVFPPIKGEL